MLVQDVLDGLCRRADRVPRVTTTTNPGARPVVALVMVLDDEIRYNATMGRGSDDIAVTANLFLSASDRMEGSAEARAFVSGHGEMSLRTAFETSTGADDPLNAVMVRTNTARLALVEHQNGETFMGATFELLVTVDGTE